MQTIFTHRWALALWLAFLLFAIPYALQARHSSVRPLAAYLLFVTVFSLCSAGLYFALTRVLIAFNGGALLSQPAGAAVFLALVVVPAFFVARWQLRRPPRQPCAPPE